MIPTMSAEFDRRRFLGLGLGAAAGAAALVVTGPQFLAPAAATSPSTPVPTKGPNLVFNASFEHDAVGSAPRGWVLS